VMREVRTSVINSTFDSDHVATECWSPASVSEVSMITPTFWTVSATIAASTQAAKGARRDGSRAYVLGINATVLRLQRNNDI
jgi:hypothetical protein